MNKEITPAVVEALTLEARVSLTDVLKRSGVSRGSFYRWRRGEGDMLPLTKARIMDAINDLRMEGRA